MSERLDRTGDGHHLAFLAGTGEMAGRMRAFDWSETSAGPSAEWPQSLKTVLRIMLDSRYPMFVWWGRSLTNFYNDAYIPILGERHPAALGRSAAEVWSEIWDTVGRQAAIVLDEGQATWSEEQLLVMKRNQFLEETYFTYSYSPIPDDEGGVGGIFCACTEDTQRVIGQRRLRTLRALAEQAAQAKTAAMACEIAAATLAENPLDLPFALFYLLDNGGSRATLAGLTGLGRDTAASPSVIDLKAADAPWPLRQAIEAEKAIEVHNLPERFGLLPLPGGAWPESPCRAVVLPMAKSSQIPLAGFLIAGISPRLAFNDDYKGFFDLLAGHVAAAIANAEAYEAERRRAEALAELDRAKTVFFSNISHEFRTPLTLMLGPVEDLLSQNRVDLSLDVTDQLEVINRNGLRLLRLVNSLLDFSRIEAGRSRIAHQPTDLAAFTAELGGIFRAAIEKAGLRLEIDCPTLGEPVFVDRDMWEKVVLNLLSNAFKFTFKGEISIRLRRAGNMAELVIRDTGTGIPAEEMPRLFERFHRIENARGRTHEGSGIGLALIQDLVHLHGGSITAESVAGQGTAFTVTIPLGSAHLAPDQIKEDQDPASATMSAIPYVEEAMRWLSNDPRDDDERPEPTDWDEAAPAAHIHVRLEQGESEDRPWVLVADDNADMRQYITRLLAKRHRVVGVPDGEAALEAARAQTPDLILTDVMMPRLDGFGLLRELRADPLLATVPIIMLSARAGEESRMEGMESGADDYLIKPFSGRELLARVTVHLQTSRMRRESSESLRQSEERLRMALTAARMVAWEWNLVNDQLIVSGEAADLFGLSPNFRKAKSAHWFALIHPDDVERHQTEVRKAVEECGSYLSQFRVIRPDNRETIWVEDRGHAVRKGEANTERLVGVVIDITERKRAEERERLLSEQAATANAQFRAFFEQGAIFAGIMAVDGVILEPNRLSLEACGYTREEVVGKLFWECPWWNRSEVLMERIKAASAHAAAGETFRAEMPYFIADGSERMVDLSLLPIKDESGRVLFLAPTGTDITDRKRAEDALLEADRRKDEFLATLAHELRNPLAPLRNGLQLMKLAKSDSEAVERARTMMERQLGQMVRLIDDLLDVSRISRGKVELRKERVDLAKIVQQAVETSRPLIEQEGHELAVSVPAEPIIVDADATRLAQVFANLLNNAAKYTESGGRIQLKVELQAGDAVVTVKDNGVGIPAPILSQVFEMFTQVDRSLEKSQGGLGIGLTLVKRLVELHGGDVEARSEGHGKGSEFVVRVPVVLPLTEEKGRNAANGEKADPFAARRRVLVVDDNRDGAESLAMMLSIMGNETRTAHDGLEALEAAKAFKPDLVMLDIGMPKLNGYDAARRIREQPWGKAMTLVALTGWGQEEDRRMSREAGFDDHIVKPIEPAALEKLLTSLRISTA